MAKTCVFCGRGVGSDGFRKVTGWARREGKCVLRAPANEWACRWCVEERERAEGQAGMIPGQMALEDVLP